MSRETIRTTQAPAAIGPYSQGVVVRAARTLYVSGQIPLDPASGTMVGGDDVVAQTERVMQNLAGVLAAAGMGFGDVVRATIYLTDLADFAAVNEVYGRRFTGEPPARACVQVAALPKGAKIEIDVVAAGE
jgi:2-iminobutanoate/2-iminopropanoate deaminase